MKILCRILKIVAVGGIIVIGMLGLLMGAVAYSKDYGVVAFKDGGYMVFKPAEGTYLPLRYDIRWHKKMWQEHFQVTESIELESCNLDCVDKGHSSGMFGISGAHQDTELPKTCKAAGDRNISHEFNSSTPLLACLGTTTEQSVLMVYFTIAPSKTGVIVMASSSKMPFHSKQFVEQNKHYILDIVNSARYEPNLWKAAFNL